MKIKSYIAFSFLFAILFCSTGCLWILPGGDVPPNLVGEGNGKKDDTVPLKDAEAAMSGAIVRALIRNGFSAERVPIAFHYTSTKQNDSFMKVLFGTGMMNFTNYESALFLIDSRLEKGVWELRLLKKDGTVVTKKTVKYRPNS